MNNINEDKINPIEHDENNTDKEDRKFVRHVFLGYILVCLVVWGIGCFIAYAENALEPERAIRALGITFIVFGFGLYIIVQKLRSNNEW